ncbi:hypothetical protein [uncultured Streptococcus sp.]|uniref:hypothetical protein n=1 Tax=uncultured Streptococcus sp. TaxID=83427 RepID=UPI002596270B|nr:hypothetical protein [uncultured Streptococcus sp.]
MNNKDLLKLAVDKRIELYASRKITLRELQDTLSVYEIKKYKSYIDAATIKRESILVHDRDTMVLWITGGSGTGKTNTLAKWICQRFNYDYSVGDAGEHFAEGYKETRAFIIDDFRADRMKFSELLNFLDNMMNVSASARYHNIDFADCKLIIITSILSPSKCYKSEAILDEPIKQLYRRLGFRYTDANGVVKNDETYLYIGSINHETLEFEKKPAKSLADGFVATCKAETDEVIETKTLIPMSTAYNETRKELNNQDMASILGIEELK